MITLVDTSCEDSPWAWRLIVRSRFLLLLVSCLGCRVDPVCPAGSSLTFAAIESDIAHVAAARPSPELRACQADAAPPRAPVDLPSLWGLALANNPALREAAADVEAGRGRLVQATKYPNPRLIYEQEALGTPGAPAGTVRVQVSQQIRTAGKRPLDIGVADRALDANRVAILGRKFAVLTRVRRVYYNYTGLEAAVRVNEAVVASLEKAVDITRKQVEEAKTRPRTDVLRLEALLENARIALITSKNNRDAAWQQLVAEVGLREPPLPAVPLPGLPETVSPLEFGAVSGRVLAVHTDLKQAILDSERAQLQVERAKAESIPDVIVAGGYSRSFVENSQGAIISVQTPIPLWDRKQGLIDEAKAGFARTVAFQHSTAARLTRETATALAQYNALRQQAERLTKEVIPRLRESLDLLLQAYQAGAAQVTFADLFQAQQDLNTARLTLAETRRNLWLAIADLEGLMQIDIDEKLEAALCAADRSPFCAAPRPMTVRP